MIILAEQDFRWDCVKDLHEGAVAAEGHIEGISALRLVQIFGPKEGVFEGEIA
jgi:hypothetical protein